jgi:hypothetical protein
MAVHWDRRCNQLDAGLRPECPRWPRLVSLLPLGPVHPTWSLSVRLAPKRQTIHQVCLLLIYPETFG